MTESKKPGVIGSLQQFQLLLYATKDTELTACDLAVLAEITDRYLKDGPRGGTTRATSAAHLAKETGRELRSVERSLVRLQERCYIMVAETGKGRAGNTYLLPFEWVRKVAADIYVYIKQFADAKKQRRKARRSARADAGAIAHTAPVVPARESVLRVFRSTDRDDGTTWLVPTRLSGLDTVVPTETPDQSYGLPTARPVGADMSAVTYGVPPPVVTKKIQSASVEAEDGEQWLTLTFEERGGDIITLESADAREQEDGQRELEQLAYSAGLSEISDAAELIGRTVYVRGGRYVAPPDDLQEAA
ncbi:hypothetical protein [Bradyrhizobium pachyrhizi]|uniref:hypothetical protein n=1 Tax=Bradyrhizobium pachyrhizi TaxID=280333 RepID=UPI003D365028